MSDLSHVGDPGWHKVRLTDKTSCQITDTKYRYFETWKKENRAWKIAYIITNKELPPRMLTEEETVAAQHAGATDESV